MFLYRKFLKVVIHQDFFPFVPLAKGLLVLLELADDGLGHLLDQLISLFQRVAVLIGLLSIYFVMFTLGIDFGLKALELKLKLLVPQPELLVLLLKKLCVCFRGVYSVGVLFYFVGRGYRWQWFIGSHFTCFPVQYIPAQRSP